MCHVLGGGGHWWHLACSWASSRVVPLRSHCFKVLTVGRVSVAIGVQQLGALAAFTQVGVSGSSAEVCLSHSFQFIACVCMVVCQGMMGVSATPNVFPLLDCQAARLAHVTLDSGVLSVTA